MASSAFRSTSKKGPPTASRTGGRREDSVKRGRRAVSKTASRTPSVVEFPNARDNPLYLTDENPENSRGGHGDPRGRSVARGSGCLDSSDGSRNGVGKRSSSRPGVGLRRPSSSSAYSQNHRSDLEQQQKRNSKLISCSSGACDSIDEARFVGFDDNEGYAMKPGRFRTQPSGDHSTSTGVTGDGSPTTENWGNRDSASYISDSEEKTVKSVCEQIEMGHSLGDANARGIYEIVREEVRRAMLEVRSELQNVIRKESSALIATVDTADTPTEQVNPDIMLFTPTKRRDQAVELEESQECARKHRVELDAEEECTSSGQQKSHLSRKRSIVQGNMSKPLIEEALNYFDECVSISTIDSAEYSSLDDQSSRSVVALQDSNGMDHGSGMSGYLFLESLGGQLVHDKEPDSPCSFRFSGASSMANSSCSSAKYATLMEDNDVEDDPGGSAVATRNNMFSFTSEGGDIRQLAKKFQRRVHKDGLENPIANKEYNPDDGVWKLSEEALLYEKVVLRNRIDSGGLLLCNRRFW